MKTGQLITFSAACLISANAIRQDPNWLDQQNVFKGTSDLASHLANDPVEETPAEIIPTDLVINEPEVALVVEAAAPVVEETDIWEGTSDLALALENTPAEETPVVTIPIDLVVNEPEAAPVVEAAAPDAETAAEAAAEDAKILE